MKIVDFAHSYLRFCVDSHVQPTITVTHLAPTTQNNVRISIECRCELTHRVTGETCAYVLGASCKTERVGAAENLWLLPNADFCMVASRDVFLIVKQWASRGRSGQKHPQALGTPQERQLGRTYDGFANFRLDVREVRGRELTTVDEIIAVTQSDAPLVSRTEYEEGNYRVMIEHPVKTMNFSHRENVYQTDTGPVLLPDLSAERIERVSNMIECFDLAYSAFNTVDWVEFIVNSPTRVADEVEVDHYSIPRRIAPVQNRLFSVVED